MSTKNTEPSHNVSTVMNPYRYENAKRCGCSTAPASAMIVPIAPSAADIFQAIAQTLPSGMRNFFESRLWFASVMWLLPSLAELQGPHIAHDRPAIVDWNRIAVRRHVAHAVRNGGEQLAIRHVADALIVKAGRRDHALLDDDALPCARAVVA